jgi:outer membrane protein assembly factor BamE (lipoprotein component of BamABCDE complex)
MKMKVVIVALVTLVSACAPNVSRPVTNASNPLTQGNVTMNLRVGETTQTDVLEVFGAPNITTVDGSGQQVWSYQRHATVSQSESGSDYWTILLAGGGRSASSLEQTQRTMTLIIKFDENNVVSDFRSRTSEF